jgi:hypothetical protein
MQLLLTLALNVNIINIVLYDVTIWTEWNKNETFFEPILRVFFTKVQLLWMQNNLSSISWLIIWFIPFVIHPFCMVWWLKMHLFGP